MKRWLWRLRGVLGIGAVWGVVGAFIATVVGLVASLFGILPLPELLEIGRVGVLGGFRASSRGHPCSRTAIR